MFYLGQNSTQKRIGFESKSTRNLKDAAELNIREGAW